MNKYEKIIAKQDELINYINMNYYLTSLTADKVGIARKHIQKENTNQEHFDICLQKKKLAVKYGAKEITWKELGLMCIKRKSIKR